MVERKFVFVGVALLALALLLGCVEAGPGAAPTAAATVEEVAEPVPLGIVLTQAPSAGEVGVLLRVAWRVNSPEVVEIQHAAVHYGPESVASPESPADYPMASRVLQGEVPGDFSVELNIAAPGTYYYRAHAIVNGVHVWSDERTVQISVVAGGQAGTPTPRPDAYLEELKGKVEALVPGLFAGAFATTGLALERREDTNYAGVFYAKESKVRVAGVERTYNFIVRRPSGSERLSQGALYPQQRVVDGRRVFYNTLNAGTPAQFHQGVVTCYGAAYYLIFEVQDERPITEIFSEFIRQCPE